jgi:hypothetical protein
LPISFGGCYEFLRLRDGREEGVHRVCVEVDEAGGGGVGHGGDSIAPLGTPRKTRVASPAAGALCSNTLEADVLRTLTHRLRPAARSVQCFSLSTFVLW